MGAKLMHLVYLAMQSGVQIAKMLMHLPVRLQDQNWTAVYKG